jgi:DNA-binding CsgD family transcriptional regulator
MERGTVGVVCEFCAKYVDLLDGHRDEIARFSIDGLSAREREVFMLLGLGLSNAELVKQLQITERTVKAHVSRILAKLGLPRAKVTTISALYFAEMCTGVHRPRRVQMLN